MEIQSQEKEEKWRSPRLLSGIMKCISDLRLAVHSLLELPKWERGSSLCLVLYLSTS